MLESASSANRCKRDSTLEPAEVEQVGPIGRRSEYDPFLMVRLRPMPGLVLSLNGEASLLLDLRPVAKWVRAYSAEAWLLSDGRPLTG